MSVPTIVVLNGPNLNLLGEREPEIYGRDTLADIEAMCRETASAFGLAIDFRQTNAEHVLVDWIQAVRTTAAGIIINPAGFTSTSVAILDALAMCLCPIIEVHLSNIHRREAFRTPSHVSRVAAGVICGCGAQGYTFAVQRVHQLLNDRER